MTNLSRWLSASTSCLLLAGCSTYVSSLVLTGDSNFEGVNESVQTYALPRGFVEITIAKDSVQVENEKVVIARKIVADSDYRFALDYDASWMASDAMQLKTTNGLLTSIWSKVEDRSYEVAINLARSVGAAQGFTLPATGGRSSTKRTAACNKALMPQDQGFQKIVIDPYSAADREAYPWVAIDDFGATPSKPTKISPERLKQTCARGICTRTVRPWRVRLRLGCKESNGVANYQYRDEVVYLPDERDVVPIDLKRAFMVERKFYAMFDSGLLSEVRLSKGSTAEELAALPEGILRALVSVPTELVQLRYNYNVQRKDFTASEIARLRQEQALRDYVAGTTKSNTPAADSGGSGGDATSEGAGEGPTPKKENIPGQPDKPKSPAGVADPPGVPDAPVEDTPPAPPPPVAPSPDEPPSDEPS